MGRNWPKRGVRYFIKGPVPSFGVMRLYGAKLFIT
jgi:hypothetical protein